MGARKNMSEIILHFTVKVNQWAKAYLGSCKGVWPLLRPGQHMWPRKSSGKHKLLRSVSYTAVGEALTPFPSSVPGSSCPLLMDFMDLVGVARGLISYLGLGFNFLNRSAFSICLNALLSCVEKKLSAFISEEETLALFPVSTFSLHWEFITEW